MSFFKLRDLALLLLGIVLAWGMAGGYPGEYLELRIYPFSPLRRDEAQKGSRCLVKVFNSGTASCRLLENNAPWSVKLEGITRKSEQRSESLPLLGDPWIYLSNWDKLDKSVALESKPGEPIYCILRTSLPVGELTFEKFRVSFCSQAGVFRSCPWNLLWRVVIFLILVLWLGDAFREVVLSYKRGKPLRLVYVSDSLRRYL